MGAGVADPVAVRVLNHLARLESNSANVAESYLWLKILRESVLYPYDVMVGRILFDVLFEISEPIGCQATIRGLGPHFMSY